MAYNCFQYKHQFKFRVNSHTYFYDHTCTQDAPLPKNYTHAHSKHFVTQITYMHFFAKLIHMHTWSIFATQRSYTSMSLLNLYTCIFKESLLPKKLHFMRIQVSFLFKLHFNSTRLLVRHLFSIYMQHTYILWGILPPTLHLYVHDEQHSQTYRCKTNIMVQPQKSAAGLKGNPYHNAFIFMLSCTQNQRLGFLGLSS